MTKWTKIYWSLAALGGVWAIFVSLLLNPVIQRNALYANRFHTAWWHDINSTESYGFAEGQVTPFRISTPDEQSLYAWHVLPVGLYARESKKWDLQTRSSAVRLSEDPAHRTRAFVMLRRDTARLIINFHGNAGHVGQGWRVDAYKSLPAVDSERIHIITFDYRGFANSTGTPSEQGLITDGIAVVNWALFVAQIPAHKIVLVGQSLGTAVATAVADHFAQVAPHRNFAGLVLCSGFSDLPTLVKTYAIGGILPILSPLSAYPRLQNYFSSRIVDTWNTTGRLTRVAAAAEPRTRIRIFHARNDFEIGWLHSDWLFNAALAGIRADVPKCEKGREYPLATDSAISPKPERGNSTETFARRAAEDLCVDANSGDRHIIPGKRLEQTILRHGGHNMVLASNYVAVAVKDLFDAAEEEAKVKDSINTEEIEDGEFEV